VCSEQENTETFKPTPLRKTSMDKFLVNFKDAVQTQVTKQTVSTAFQQCYISSNVGNSRLPEEMSTHCGWENCDVKMWHLARLETHQQLYYKAKYGGTKWGGLLLGAEQLRC
jgi:hypothetical protein